MEKINLIFERIEKLTKFDDAGFIKMLLHNGVANSKGKDAIFISKRDFLHKLFKEIDDLASHIKNDDTVLISVRNQKLLRTCFQFIVSLGISPCLVPGLGISVTKRSSLSAMLPTISLSDEQKYELLTECTDFFVRNYSIPVLKHIIISFHLSDYLASLIQLSFAPLKKTGVYKNFTMTQEMYDKLNIDRKKYIKIYDDLVSNCFQPILMKELLVLQNVTEKTPTFVKRTVTKELSRRLIAPGGFLSLIRCFMDSLEIDSGKEWQKIDIICKLIATKHGNTSDIEYVKNICNQLKQILILNNIKYLTTATACLITLIERYPESIAVNALTKEVFDTFICENVSQSLPGTIILTTQQIEHQVQTYHSALCLPNQEIIVQLLTPNVPLLFLLGIKCNNEGIKNKINDILIKCMEKMKDEEISLSLKLLLFGNTTLSNIIVEEFQAGLILKSVNNNTYPFDDALFYFMELFKQISDYNFIQNVLQTLLQMLIDLSMRRNNLKLEPLFTPEDEPILLNDMDIKYINILQLLSIITESSKITDCLKKSPQIVFNFIEYFLQENKNNSECETIALILLNTILPNLDHFYIIKFKKIIPLLENISHNESNTNSILCKEAISLINGDNIKKRNSAYEKAVSNAFDNLVPTRAHGIIELTKLIDRQDAETISKRHLLFCLFKEQLKDGDSYIYLAAINGIASLALHCTEDVLNVLCQEFINITTRGIETRDMLNKVQEMRLKIGDIIVKITKRLGDMSIVHKSILLNTMLTACRDHDPLIRASALSNLAEISLVLHYKIGSIIYEVLLCIGSILETDRAIECRRAAVMVISSLLKGLGKDALIQLKEHLLPLYRTLNKLYKNPNEDRAVKLHAQIALEEVNDIVYQFLLPNIEMEKPFSLLDEPKDIVYK